jgi:hypothetical protein
MDAEFRGIDISITTEEEPKQQIGFEQEASDEAFYGATHGEDFAGRAADVTGREPGSSPGLGQGVPASGGAMSMQVNDVVRNALLTYHGAAMLIGIWHAEPRMLLVIALSSVLIRRRCA